MLTVKVRQDGTGDFTAISEAVNAVPYDISAVIDIGSGIYREKVFCEKKRLILRGAGQNETHLIWGDGGRMPHPDGRTFHTFRTYTAFFGGESIRVEDMTIENDAGPGTQVGQAIAAYVDCADAVFERVRLLGNQDTLFCAPLPEKEREPMGFLGPRMLSPRCPSVQRYLNCEIAGEVDFIFGGADALFENCTIRSVSAGRTSYVAAPSGYAENMGFVFHRCRFEADAEVTSESVYLARPWRPEGKTAVIHCALGGHIHPSGFSPWNDRADYGLAAFAEFGNTSEGAVQRPAWVHVLTEEEVERLLQGFSAER